ncbi:MAG: peptidoglycan DD-metalloendopeptidase family protein [Solirubrobacteraceae bacterium]
MLAALACASGVWLLSHSGAASAASIGRLRQQLSTRQRQVSSLSGAVDAASSRLVQLHAAIAGLQQQISRIQADLDQQRAELLKLRADLGAAAARLAQLEAFEAHAASVLSQQLVSSYESDRPDIVTVVLESTGFQDLLEQVAFEQRIEKRNEQVVSQVRRAREAVSAQATRLGALEVRQQTLTSAVLSQRNSLAGTKFSLAREQEAVAAVRGQKASQLAGARAQVGRAQSQLSSAEAAAAAAAAAAVAAQRAAQHAAQSRGAASPAGSSPPSGPASGGSAGTGKVSTGGGFTFPMPRGAAAPPSTWSLDQGVDISAPGGTPELAVCSGTIVLHGIGGFGPWAPVIHCDTPLAGYGYVYYGHAGPANQLPVGTHVSAGQVMSEVGPGIVGISSGPHLEIGFADASGSPIGSGSAPAMMSLLQGSYGG